MAFITYPLNYKRRKTRVVEIGDVKIGGDHPILIQSMLTSPTSDIEKCMEEIRALNHVNCELIRLSLTSGRDLDAISRLREKMKSEGIFRPLVADVHFSPQLAIDACEVFEKIRINPGNFTDKPKNSKRNKTIELSEGREQLKESIQPLVKNLKKYDRALRIGVNQGSLSSRMIEHYGDSPMGMVASATEMIDLLEAEGIKKIVVSLKSSNPSVVLQAYRLLVEQLPKENGIPLHLGVTEAGNGIIGRIKSLSGIGPLLFDGIGDTIRVSLTEECCNEIAYARELVSALSGLGMKSMEAGTFKRAFNDVRVNHQAFSIKGLTIGGATPVKIGKPESINLPASEMEFLEDFRYKLNREAGTIGMMDGMFKFALISEKDDVLYLEKGPKDMILIESENPLTLARQIYMSRNNRTPVGLKFPVFETPEKEIGYFVQIASILSEGLADFILMPEKMDSKLFDKFLCLLQATRTRLLAPDYIACPSCGRTLFDLKTTTERIKRKTSHLKGVKIGIMGCIVNGPGEMADADFGYVGSGKGKVDLYFGKERVKRGIHETDAVDALIDLIKEHRMWVEPKEK